MHSNEAVALKPKQGLNVLDDDILDTADHAQTTTLNNTAGALTNQGLVGANGDTKHTSIVTGRRVSTEGTLIIAQEMGYLLGDSSGSGIRLVVGAPVVLVDGNLAAGASTPRSTTGARGGALSIGEVETSISPLSAIAHPRQGSSTHVLLRTMTRASSSPR